MTKHIFVVYIFILFYPFQTFSQGEWNNWYFGQYPPFGAGVTFNTGYPIAIPNTMVSNGKVTACISDSVGNFLLYSEGLLVFNKNLVLMPNGCCINGQDMRPFGQPVFVIPKLDDDSSYYVFTAGSYEPLGTTHGLEFSIVNMRLDGGLGDIEVTNKNIPIPGALNAWHAVTGTRHSNNKDIWIVTTLSNIDSLHFAAYLVNESGLSYTPVQSFSFGNGHYPSPVPHYMYSPNSIKISSDGTKLVALFGTKLEYCSFNATTGNVAHLFFINTGYQIIYGSAEFSVDSKYLYVYSTLNGGSGVIQQFDVSQTDSVLFSQSKVLIDSGNIRSGLQLAPNWKIYGTESSKDSLCVINSPSTYGSSCNYQRNAVALTGQCRDELPQFIQKYKAYIHHSGSCEDNPIHFNGDIYPPPDSVHWDFGDPASGASNYSTLPSPSHIYSTTGTYTVELFVRHNDNRTDTSWQTITILPSPQPIIGADGTICAGNSTTFDAGACSGCTYLWKDVASGLTVGTGQTLTTSIAGLYAVTVTNANNCSGTDTVQLVTTPVPVVTNIPLSKSICSGESTNIPLTSNVSGTMFHWTATLTSGFVIGFSPDSGLIINQILFNTGAVPGIVTFHITPKVGSCEGSTVNYQVTVTPGNPVMVSIAASTNNICAGTPVTFSATPTNGGTTPGYQWKVNGNNVGAGNPSYSYNPASGDQVSCVLTSSNTVCTSNNPATSNIISMIVNPILPVSVLVSPSANQVCAGTSVTFTATPTNGGTPPVFQWKVNGGIVGTNSQNYTYIPLNGDIVTCNLTSNALCETGSPATSIPVTMIVNPNLPVSILISASSNPFCIGGSVTFTAAPTNGGATPSYQWKANGANVGSNSPTYSYNPVSGDLVTCILTSTVSCPTGNPATSNTLTMIGNLALPAGISIIANPNPFCPGSSVTFTATPGNGGANPSYQWKVNGGNAGTNSPTFIYNPANSDSVRCVMTSNLACVSSNPATSNQISMSGTLAPSVTFTSCFDTMTTVNAKPFKLKGGIPHGGTYSGPGVNSITGTFTPSIAGTGLKTIVYTYTNVSLCSANKTRTILVLTTAPFVCGNNLTDIRDGKSYPSVQIGLQCWMAANLNHGTNVNSPQIQNDNCIAEKYCYNDQGTNCTLYGGLYRWDELMQYDDTPANQGLCPPGWHVPTENEWTTLFNFYSGNGFAGKPLQDPIIGGFNALTSGVFYMNTSWSFNGFATLFWSSTPWGTYKALSHGMNIYNYSVSLYPSSRANAFPVRCLHD